MGFNRQKYIPEEDKSLKERDSKAFNDGKDSYAYSSSSSFCCLTLTLGYTYKFQKKKIEWKNQNPICIED